MTIDSSRSTALTTPVSTLRRSALIVSIASLLGALAYLILTIGFQLGRIDIGTESIQELIADRDLNWAWYGITGVTVVLLAAGVSATTWFLTPRRGFTWIATGGAMAVVGAACVAVGEGSQAAILYFGTLPELGDSGRQAIIAATNADLGHTLGVLLPGNILWHLSFVAFGVGLLRTRSVPRWIAIAFFLSAVLSFMPAGGPAFVAVIGEVVHAVGPTSVAILLLARSVGMPTVRSARG